MSSYAQSWMGQAVWQVVGQVSDLPEFLRRTRPRPLLHALNQPSAHRVLFDVACDALKFPIAAHPVVIGFILPEGVAGVAKNDVGLSGTSTFDGSGYLSQRFVRLKKNVHVVGHQNPDEEIAQLPSQLRRKQRVDNDSGDARICQPFRTRSRIVQLSVSQCEPLSFRGGNTVCTQITDTRQRAVKPPCQKDWNTFRVPMRQSTTIETDRTTVLTRLDNSHYGRSETCSTHGRSETCSTHGRSETCFTYGRSETCSTYGRSETCPTL